MKIIKAAMLIIFLVALFYVLIALCLIFNKVNETLKLVRENHDYCFIEE